MKPKQKPSLSELIRTHNWAYSKIPPLLAVAYALILVNRIEFRLAFPTLLLIFGVCGVSAGAYGHIINDIFDIQQDAAAGKKNAMARLSRFRRVGLCLFFIASGFAPLVLLDFGRTATILLVVNYLLPTVYSMPPIRLKERGVLGVIADAAGAHVVPTLFVALSVAHVKPADSMVETSLLSVGNLDFMIVASATIWGLFAGLRNIIVHQIADRRDDIQAGVSTFVGQKQRKAVRKFVLTFLYPWEIIGLTLFVSCLLPFSQVLLSLVVIYVIGELLKMKFCKLPLFFPEHPTRESYIPLLNNEFYEVWLPCALVSQLALNELSFGLIWVLHIALFRTLIREKGVMFGEVVISVLGSVKVWMMRRFPWLNRAPRLKYTSKGGYFRSHPILGYAPKKHRQVKAQKFHGKRKLYEVNYTINPDGLRVGSNQAKAGTPSVLFFGGSFTFGDGVNDDEAMPYQFEEKSDGAFKSFNFGFHGYGPHQMLAILENGMEKAIVRTCPPQFVVYFAIPEHLAQCTGNAYWDTAGPRYRLNANGTPEYAGPFYGFFRRNLMKVMNRFRFLTRFISTKQGASATADMSLFIQIVKAAEEMVNARYRAQFYVLLWDTGDSAYTEILSELKANQIAVLEISDILLAHDFTLEKYTIPDDVYPNPLAHEQIAAYLSSALRHKLLTPSNSPSRGGGLNLLPL
jgi:4-hydroxybenzoate polyprenyltransferase